MDKYKEKRKAYLSTHTVVFLLAILFSLVFYFIKGGTTTVGIASFVLAGLAGITAKISGDEIYKNYILNKLSSNGSLDDHKKVRINLRKVIMLTGSTEGVVFVVRGRVEKRYEDFYVSLENVDIVNEIGSRVREDIELLVSNDVVKGVVKGEVGSEDM